MRRGIRKGKRESERERERERERGDLLVAFLTQPFLLFFGLALVAFVAKKERKKERKKESSRGGLVR